MKYVTSLAAAIGGVWLSSLHHSPIYAGALVGLGALCAVVVTQQDRSGTRQAYSRERSAALSRGTAARALIVGAGSVGRSLADSLEQSGRYSVVGFVDDDEGQVAGGCHDLRVLGTRAETLDVVDRYAVDEVFLAYAPTWQQELVRDLACSSRGVGVHIIPTAYEALLPTSRVGNAGDIALVRLAMDSRSAADAAKRAFDVCSIAIAAPVLVPTFALVAAVIKLTSRGPAIFAQERVGRHGKLFRVYKFRTMVHDAEAETGPVLSTGNGDTRLTRVGRWLRLFRVDEIPQLWNVLRGEMSLVGPRPERPCFVEEFTRTIPCYAQRHNVRPGITGLAQVRGGYHTDARDKLRFDLIYVSHRSVRMDLAILLRTVLVVVFPERH